MKKNWPEGFKKYDALENKIRKAISSIEMGDEDPAVNAIMNSMEEYFLWRDKQVRKGIFKEIGNIMGLTSVDFKKKKS